MTKLIILIIIAALLYLASPKVTFKPFSVTFTNGYLALGILLIGIGVGLIRYQGYVEGAMKGVSAVVKYLRTEIKKEKV